MTTAEVEILDSVVRDDIILVEHQVIEADTRRELEVVADVPLILQVQAELVEGDVRGSLTTVVTIVDSHSLRSSTVQEVIDRTITIVSRTTAQITVVGGLVLEVESCRDLVLGQVVSEVIRHGGDLVGHTVQVREQLVTQ